MAQLCNEDAKEEVGIAAAAAVVVEGACLKMEMGIEQMTSKV